MEYVICVDLVHYMSSQKGIYNSRPYYDYTVMGTGAHQYGMHSKKHMQVKLYISKSYKIILAGIFT